ncbi:MAG: metalloregulator ArsR/SmtB family transcription factor [Deltaproteobacteria bacterium]|nr:metalloregulator ArsR/SmtB family transcription factor [Deltaproteobacteria bacterium]
MPHPDVIAEKHRLVAEIAGALSNPVRLRILGALGQREQSVDQLADRLGLTGGNASAQLRVLARVHLLRDRREGRRVFYRLAGPEVLQILLAMQDAAAKLTPGFREMVRTHLGDPRVLSADEAEGLVARAQSGELQLVDVRSATDHAAAHLPGAVSVPLSVLQDRDESAVPLDRERPVVVYCRGRYCLAAAEAVGHLEAMGFHVTNLFAGVTEVASLGVDLVAEERAPVK